MDEKVAAKPRLARNEVVVDVETFTEVESQREPFTEHVERSCLQCVTIGLCEVQRPREILQVCGPLLRRDVETSKIVRTSGLHGARVVQGYGRTKAA